MADDDLLPGGSGDGAPRAAAPKNVQCEFCECRLAPSGEVLKMGNAARGYRDQAEKIEKLEKQLTAAREKVTQLESELSTIKTAARQQAADDDDSDLFDE